MTVITIHSIQDWGTVVSMYGTDEDNNFIPVHWDHRQFAAFADDNPDLACPFTVKVGDIDGNQTVEVIG